MVPKHISVCICTYRRPALLGELLNELGCQACAQEFTYSIVVADNDPSRSAEQVVRSAAEKLALDVQYGCEPRRNIALARNLALSLSRGDFVAFIDDDELPPRWWLLSLLDTCENTGADGVLGPVLPRFERPPPRWIIRGGFCERPRHLTGFRMPWRECRTGNVLLKRGSWEGIDAPFRACFGAGGEDVDFFRRMSQEGKKFVWCNEAVVYEVVPPHRLTHGFLLRRALLRGQISAKNPECRKLAAVKSLVAVPLYASVLPLLLVLGHHWFMRYLVSLCDHLGMLLGLSGIRFIRSREM